METHNGYGVYILDYPKANSLSIRIVSSRSRYPGRLGHRSTWKHGPVCGVMCFAVFLPLFYERNSNAVCITRAMILNGPESSRTWKHLLASALIWPKILRYS